MWHLIPATPERTIRMTRFWRFVCPLLAASLSPSPRAQTPASSVPTVVKHVESNLSRLRSQLPDFICRETITSQSFRGKQLGKFLETPDYTKIECLVLIIT